MVFELPNLDPSKVSFASFNSNYDYALKWPYFAQIMSRKSILLKALNFEEKSRWLVHEIFNLDDDEKIVDISFSQVNQLHIMVESDDDFKFFIMKIGDHLKICKNTSTGGLP